MADVWSCNSCGHTEPAGRCLGAVDNCPRCVPGIVQVIEVVVPDPREDARTLDALLEVFGGLTAEQLGVAIEKLDTSAAAGTGANRVRTRFDDTAGKLVVEPLEVAEA